MSDTLMVGCPVLDRLWIMPRWFAYTEAACQEAGLEPHYIFVGDPNDPTVSFIEDSVKALGRQGHVWQVTESRHPYQRNWSIPRYQRMVEIRNYLLRGVRAFEPTYFLSLDSDILIQKEVLSNLIETQRNWGYNAVGGKCFLTPLGTGTWAPSWANLVENGQRLERWDASDVRGSECIMAIKLMTHSAYMIDYEVHEQGEDIGWSLACKRDGLNLGWDGRNCSKHVMSRVELDPVDMRCGY